MILYRSQERPESCVPACVRMVLTSIGIDATEEALYNCCETDINGTLPSRAALCAQSLGLVASSPRLSGLEELQKQISFSHPYPIVFVNLSPILGINMIHAVIVEAIDTIAKTISIIDPAYPPSGRHQWNLTLFEIGWRQARHQTILIAIP